METKMLKFKTNIKCGGCISKVTPFLDNTKGIVKWEVDTANPDKILSVEIDGISENEVIRQVTNAGFKIDSLNK